MPSAPPDDDARPASAPSRFTIPRHRGKVEQPQKALPCRGPLRATRRTMRDPHSGQITGDVVAPNSVTRLLSSLRHPKGPLDHPPAQRDDRASR